MPESLARLSVHLIFSTKNHEPLLKEPALRFELYRAMGGILRNLNSPPYIINGTEDHVHCLFALGRDRSLAEVVKEVKEQSAAWLKPKSPALGTFAWQNGYGAVSVDHSEGSAVEKFIAGQEDYHKTVTFQDEFRQFLKRHEISFEERFLWD